MFCRLRQRSLEPVHHKKLTPIPMVPFHVTLCNTGEVRRSLKDDREKLMMVSCRDQVEGRVVCGSEPRVSSNRTPPRVIWSGLLLRCKETYSGCVPKDRWCLHRLKDLVTYEIVCSCPTPEAFINITMQILASTGCGKNAC